MQCFTMKNINVDSKKWENKNRKRSKLEYILSPYDTPSMRMEQLILEETGMDNLNSVLVEGNLTRDPEFVTAPNGTSLCRFGIASSRYYGQNGVREKEVNFFDVEAWAKLAESVNAAGRKGRGARVVGRLKQERWNDGDGKSKSKIVIVAEHIDFRPDAKSANKANASVQRLEVATETESESAFTPPF